MKVRPIDGQQHGPLPQFGDLVGVGEQLAAGKRAGVKDQAVEDVQVLVGQHVLDDADALPMPVVDRGADLEYEIRDRKAQIIHHPDDTRPPCRPR